MRKTFSSYGPVSTKSNFFVPRTELVERAVRQMVGEVPEEGGHFFTVWASRQTGKSWVMLEAYRRLRRDPTFHTTKIELQLFNDKNVFLDVANYIIEQINTYLRLALPIASSPKEFEKAFTSQHLDRPLLLILDEFDSLPSEVIQEMVKVFRNIYMFKKKTATELGTASPYMLHGLCLIGVRSVLGVENAKGSPFNVQRSMHIANLTEAEVNEMYHWYERESGQKIEQNVIDRLFYETRGQPGLVSWFGELLTEQFNTRQDQPITLKEWDFTYAKATEVLPDNNILNIISKAKDPAYLPTVLDMFRTDAKTPFSFDKPDLNYLYMNGVITYETDESGVRHFARFPCPYLQKRLFNRFSDDVFHEVYPVVNHFDELKDAVTPDGLVVRNILRRYQVWLDRELKKDYFLKGAPRRSDLRVCEAVWHFSLYRYLANMLCGYKVRVHPEFPTGNGKVDLILMYKEKMFAIEVKSYSQMPQYHEAIEQSAQYARSLGLPRILLAFFIDAIDDDSRQRLERDIPVPESDVLVEVFFLITGQTN